MCSNERGIRTGDSGRKGLGMTNTVEANIAEPKPEPGTRMIRKKIDCQSRTKNHGSESLLYCQRYEEILENKF
jgi:hypothetical protein